MRKDLQRKLIQRFILAWVGLSILLSTFVFWLENRRIDEIVAQLALNDSQLFTSFDQRLQWQQEAERLVHRDFLMVKIYNSQGESVLQVTNNEGQHALETLGVIPQHFNSANPYYKKYYLNQHMLMMIVVPIYDAEHKLQGFFEGIYEIPQETLKIISNRVLWSLFEILLVTSVMTLVFYPMTIGLNRESAEFSYHLLKTNIDMVKVLGAAIAKRDLDTYIHNYKVTVLAVSLGQAYGLDLRSMQALIKGSFLHDVGKIGIQDEILLKPDCLTQEEFQAIQQHVQHGLDIISYSDWLKDAQDIVRYHHERFDGKGYLEGLAGDKIPVSARIFALADVFEALTSKRPYKDPYSLEKSMKIIKENRGAHFDPVIVDLFLQIAPNLYEKVCLADDDTIKQQLLDIWTTYFYET